MERTLKIEVVLLIFFTTLITILLITISFANPPPNTNLMEHSNLTIGKNNISFNEYFYASEIINWNPKIESISYRTLDNQTIGYVNTFGGIGKNFLILPNQTYEISTNQNISLKIHSRLT